MSQTLRIQPRFIGLTGRKGAGKDTVAANLVEVFSFQRFAFAEPIKKALAAIFEVETALFEDVSVKEAKLDCLLGQSPRHLMQTLGTEWGRDIISPTMWIDLLMLKATHAIRESRHVVVSDVRFDSEAAAIKQQGGVIWEIVRPKLASIEDLHRSEAGIDRKFIDRTIENNMNLRMLYTQVGVAIANFDRDAARRNHSPAI